MENYNSESKSVLLKGRVCYEDGLPAENAEVMVEAIFFYNNGGDKKKYSKKFCGSTFTNNKGEFSYLIDDTKCYYKIKVVKKIPCDEEKICTNKEKYNIYLE